MTEPTQTRVPKAGRCTGLLLTVVLALAAALALSGNAMAATGVPCAPTGLETISTDQESYPPGETVYISGGGYAIACDVEIRITRPDGVVETATVTSDLGGNLVHEYVLPPFPGVLGTYTLDAVGLGGAVLASHTFTDGPEIKSPDLVPGYVTTGGARMYTVLVRNTGDTTHRCIRLTLAAGYTSISVLSSDASQGSFNSSISGQVITFTNSTGITGTTTPAVNGWARFDIQATPPNNGPNGSDWTFRAWSNTACNSNQTSNETVRIVAGTQPIDRRYTAEFVTAGGAPITTPITTGSNVTFRLRMTKLNDSQSNRISYFSVGLPRCLTGISISSAGENSSNGFDWTAEMFGKVVRWSDPTSGELDDGHSVTLTFTANTTGCALSNHAFESTGWEDAAGSAGNAPSKLFTTTASGTVTFAAANTAPTVARDNATVTVNEGQTATNTGTWSDPDAGQTVTLTASVGTVTKNADGTWSWSYATTDGPDQSQTVTITATDNASTPASSSTTFALTVNNVAPTATFNAPASVNEGSNINISLSSPSDPSSVDTAAGFEYRFSCDDGTTWTAWDSSTSHACATDDNGSRDVKGEIRDKDGGTSTYSASVTVNNVAPSATFNAPESVNEGSNIDLSLTSPSDPSFVDTAAGFEYRFSCDNGTTWTAWGSSSTASCSTNDNGSRNVKGEIRDKDGGTTTYSAAVTVDNVAPSATFNAPGSVNEGSNTNLSLTDVVDPGTADTHEYRFSCDGGTTWTAWGSSNTHACPTTDNGTKTVNGQVRDDDGGMSAEYSATVTVNNVAPSATFNAPASVNEGSNINLSLTDVVDPGAADTHEFRFSCDGGTTWTDWSSDSTHACATDDNGTRSVKGQVRDDDGGESAEYSATITVNNVAPTATFNDNGPVDEGSNINLSLSGPFDPSSVDTAAGFQYAFDCGFGYGDFGDSNAASCATSDNGVREVKGKIRDKDGGVSEYMATVTVNNVAPSATFNAPTEVNEGSNINLSLTNVVDPGTADTHEFRFSCDSGTTWTDWSSDNTHACATTDNGTVEVHGQVRDDDAGLSEVYSDSVTVNNVAPSATFTAPESVNEGGNIDLSLTNVVDPGTADTHEFRFSCDNGATWTDWSSDDTHACATTDNGTVEVRAQVRDDDGGESAEYSAAVTVNNVAPTAVFNNSDPVNEGSNINVSLTNPSDPSSADTAAGFQYRFSCDNGATWTAWSSDNTHACATDDNGTKNVKGEIRDKDLDASTYSAAVTVDNVAPTATFAAPESVNEGSNINLSLTSPSDPSSADTAAGFQYRFSCDNGVTWTDWGSSNTHACPTHDNGTRNVKGEIRDKDGGTTTYSAAVTVNNVPPTLTSLTPSSYLVLKGTSVSATGTYTDPGTGDTFTCIVNWDEPTGTPENVAGGSGSCSAAHTYTAQGTYTVSMKVRDDDGGESNTLKIIITVYDPSAGGFVTGGGWIMSPKGSYAADPDASGRANFGFNSQYKKGASVPTGETEFQLHFASFNFHSDTYEVLVVSGYKAQYRGTGKVNGVGGHKFVLTAYDGQITGGGGADRFRIKITRVADDVVVYDTRMGTSEDMDDADPLALGGGSIVIHKAK